MTVNLIPPSPARLFNGPLLRDMLEDRYVAGIAAVYRLEPEAFGPAPADPADPDDEPVELDPAASIMAAVDVTLPTIDWDTPQTLQGITREQRMLSVVSFPVTGPTAPLTWIPTSHQIGAPPVRFGLAGGRLVVVCDSIDPHVMTTATTRARRHVSANLAYAIEERNTWRAHTARRIRDAVSRRRELIDALAATN